MKRLEELQACFQGVIPSPILGPEGNREFLVAFHHGVECADLANVIAAVTAP